MHWTALRVRWFCSPERRRNATIKSLLVCATLAYHGLVNLDVAQGQGCYGGNPSAGFEQFNAAASGRVGPAG